MDAGRAPDGLLNPGLMARALAGTTVPEAKDTLAAQQRQLLDGSRHAQMFPTGSSELPLPQGMARAETPKGVFHYNPARLGEEAIWKAVSTGQENEILNLGPVSKAEVMQRAKGGETPLSVVERGPAGHEIRAAAGTSGTAPAQIAAMAPNNSPGSGLYVESPQATLMARLLRGGN